MVPEAPGLTVTDSLPSPRASQARSRKTRHAILSAAVEVLIGSGIDGFTMTAISSRAGVSVGSIYRRFGGKEQLLAATQAEFTSNFIEQLASKLTSAETTRSSSSQRVRHAVEALVSTFRENGSAMKVLVLLGLQDAQIYSQGSIASVGGGAMYIRFLGELGDSIAHADRDAAIDFTYRLIYAMCCHRLTQGEFLESTRPLDWDELSRSLCVTVEAYLLRPQ